MCAVTSASCAVFYCASFEWDWRRGGGPATVKTSVYRAKWSLVRIPRLAFSTVSIVVRVVYDDSLHIPDRKFVTCRRMFANSESPAYVDVIVSNKKQTNKQNPDISHNNSPSIPG